MIRLGEQEQPTFRTEKLYLLNSLAKGCGVLNAELPFDVTFPPQPSTKEHMGLTFELPSQFRESDGDDDEEDDGAAGAADMQNFLAGIVWDDDDTPVDPTQFQPRSERETEAELDSTIDEEGFVYGDLCDEELDPKYEKEMALALPAIVEKESTMEAFIRLTAGRPWVPFKHPRETQSALDAYEYALFDLLEKNYDRFCAYPNSVRGYKRFEKEWDRRVANLYREKLTQLDGGEKELQVINRKTYLQLQQHYDNLAAQKRTAALVKPNDPVQKRLGEELRRSRREMPPTQEAINVRPIQYQYHQGGIPMFGAPTALNTRVAARAVTYNPAAIVDPRAPYNYCINPPRPTARGVGLGYKSKLFCTRCGYRKKDHGSLPFGFGCTQNMGREECSKCFTRLEFHNIGEVGPFCKNAPHAGSQFNEWYVKTTEI